MMQPGVIKEGVVTHFQFLVCLQLTKYSVLLQVQVTKERLAA